MSMWIIHILNIYMYLLSLYFVVQSVAWVFPACFFQKTNLKLKSIDDSEDESKPLTFFFYQENSSLLVQ